MMKIFLWMAVCLFGCEVMAADVFVMSNVPVSAQADNAVKARDIAMEEGQKQAFTALMDKIVLASDRAKITTPAQDVPTFVQDVSVAQEKTGANRYAGELTVRFKAPMIRSFLKSHTVSFLSRLPQPMLVVPVLNDGVQTSIFDENSPLYRALKEKMPQSNLFQFKLPSGDAEEMTIAAAAAQRMEYNTFKPLLDKYNLNGILVLTVLKSGSSYQLSTKVLPAGSAPEAEVVLTVSDDREDLDKVMADLSQDALKAMEKKWLYLASDSAFPLMVYHVFVPVEKVSDLARAQQRAQQIKFADKVDIKGFMNKRLAVDFYFRGNEADFAQKLKLSGLKLVVEQSANINGKPVYLLLEDTQEMPTNGQQAQPLSLNEEPNIVPSTQMNGVELPIVNAVSGQPVGMAQMQSIEGNQNGVVVSPLVQQIPVGGTASGVISDVSGVTPNGTMNGQPSLGGVTPNGTVNGQPSLGGVTPNGTVNGQPSLGGVTPNGTVNGQPSLGGVTPNGTVNGQPSLGGVTPNGTVNGQPSLGGVTPNGTVNGQPVWSASSSNGVSVAPLDVSKKGKMDTASQQKEPSSFWQNMISNILP